LEISETTDPSNERGMPSVTEANVTRCRTARMNQTVKTCDIHTTALASDSSELGDVNTLINQSGRSAISNASALTSFIHHRCVSDVFRWTRRPAQSQGSRRVTALRTLSSLNLLISLYLLHHTQNARREPLCGNGLNDAHAMYKERANECQRLWMKLEGSSCIMCSRDERAADLSPSRSRLDPETSPFTGHHSDTSQHLMKISQLKLKGTTRLRTLIL
jgi:hypothetical protein